MRSSAVVYVFAFFMVLSAGSISAQDISNKLHVSAGTFKATADLGGTNKLGYTICGDYSFRPTERGEWFAGIGYTAYRVTDIPVPPAGGGGNGGNGGNGVEAASSAYAVSERTRAPLGIGSYQKADVALTTAFAGYRIFLTPEQSVYAAPALVLAHQRVKLGGASETKTKLGGTLAIGARFAERFTGEFFWNIGADDVFRGWGVKGGVRF